jgi:hypothetical protein
MEVGPEKYVKCSGRTANAGGIYWRYSGEARNHGIRCDSGGRIDGANCVSLLARTSGRNRSFTATVNIPKPARPNRPPTPPVPDAPARLVPHERVKQLSVAHCACANQLERLGAVVAHSLSIGFGRRD